MAGDPKSYAVYKAVAEMPASLRNRVIKTMEHEMTFDDLRTELEKVASLKVMEEAVGKPKPQLHKVTATATSGQAGGAAGGGATGGGTRQRRFLPEGFNPSMFGCLRCGERTEPPHEARNCTLEKKNLECTYCGIKGSHLEAVCFKKLEVKMHTILKKIILNL